jgi:hypothetical protein
LALIGRVYALAVLDVLEHASARRPHSRTAERQIKAL